MPVLINLIDSSDESDEDEGAAASSSSRMESAGLMRLVAASARPDAEGRGAAGQHGRRDEPGGGGREARLGRDARRPVADAILFLPKLPDSVDRDALRRLFSAFGTVVDVSRSRRSGTVCFQTGAEAKRALAAVSAATPSPEAAAAEPLPLCVDDSSVARVTQAGELSRLRVEFALIDKLPKGMRGKEVVKELSAILREKGLAMSEPAVVELRRLEAALLDEVGPARSSRWRAVLQRSGGLQALLRGRSSTFLLTRVGSGPSAPAGVQLRAQPAGKRPREDGELPAPSKRPGPPGSLPSPSGGGAGGSKAAAAQRWDERGAARRISGEAGEGVASGASGRSGGRGDAGGGGGGGGSSRDRGSSVAGGSNGGCGGGGCGGSSSSGGRVGGVGSGSSGSGGGGSGSGSGGGGGGSGGSVQCNGVGGRARGESLPPARRPSSTRLCVSEGSREHLATLVLRELCKVGPSGSRDAAEGGTDSPPPTEFGGDLEHG
ncbi:hypothetical protein EMIHUDRAFT_449328, partial [Emiliania huxleyi CCMP1516]|uniref:RRM domain-containing protein n=2 Tax=Emiliania huxleyi TaxID=2903 RepID=A0A0D3KEU1_EMIH1